ncbi:MAG: response regulator [Candidatus Scalindua sp.]
MSEKKINVLLVEDEKSHADLICRSFESAPGLVNVEVVHNLNQARNSISQSAPDLIITDYILPDGKGTELIPPDKEKSPYPVIILTSRGDEQVAVEAMKAGAFDYIVKSEVTLDNMPHTCEKLLLEWNHTIERKQTEEALRESEEKYRAMFETSNVGMTLCKMDGSLLECNQAYLDIIGYTNEEALQLTYWDVTPTEFKEEEARQLRSLEETGRYGPYEKEYIRKDSKRIPVLLNGAIVNGADGNDYIWSIVQDITERKQSERRLNAQHEVTKVLAGSATIKEASPKILQSICTALEWDLGEIWEIHQQKKALYNTEIWHLPSLNLSEFKDATKQTTFSPQSGLPGRIWESAEPLWIADVVNDTNFLRASVAEKVGLHGAFGFPIIIGSEVLGTFCFFSREIREPDKSLLDMMTAIGRQIGLFIKRKQVEEALLQSEKLQSLGTITAGVSHDFNNILTIISDNVQLLEGRRSGDEELTKILRTIKKAGNDGAQIVRGMLKFTKTAEDTAGFMPFDINELINQAIDFTKPRWQNAAQAGGISYHIDTEGMKMVPTVLCDTTEMREVFVNMINNALDAMPDGGCITVATRCVRRPAEAESAELRVEGREDNASGLRTQTYELKGDFVEIKFTDNGAGMSGKVRKRIFDPFFSTKGVEGTGLGLSTTYGVVTGHGGNIEVESEEGKGSTFILQLPQADKADSPEESSEKKQEMKANSLRILVVEDEEQICDILVKFLTGGGHMVRTVDNGREAIILSKIVDYDLILCDLAMPEVNGQEVVQALNKLEKRPKIGLITGWDGEIKPVGSEDIKVDFIIKKPFGFSELTKQMNKLFD